MLLVSLLLIINVVQYNYNALFPPLLPIATKQPDIAELLRTACPVSNDQPVAILISAKTPSELLTNVNIIQAQLDNFTRYSYGEIYKERSTVRK